MGDQYTGRRKAFRFQAAFRVKYNNLDNLIDAYTKDISKGGIFIETDRFLPLNTVVSVALALPDTDQDMRCIAQIVRVQDKSEGDQIQGMAMEFLDLSEERVQFIEKTIARHAVKEAETSLPARIDHKLSVLVVDDDKSHREMGAKTFRAAGHRVVTAENGVEALTACLKEPPDIVLTDVQMPIMDGWSFLRTIRARPSLASTLVIFQTTLASEKDRLKGYQLGVDDYLAKPYKPDELMARVDRLMTRVGSKKMASSTKALRGDLEQVSLPTILSLLDLERKTGVVIVVGPRTCRIFVRDGRPVDLEIDGDFDSVNPIETAVEILGWKEGQFEFAPQDVSRNDVLRTSLSSLLLEAARISDERGR